MTGGVEVRIFRDEMRNLGICVVSGGTGIFSFGQGVAGGLGQHFFVVRRGPTPGERMGPHPMRYQRSLRSRR